nr:reverse transcriptase domain-containing protein [Tanacetum cinerariifolium]
APRSPEYVPDPIELEDHVPAHIPEHPEDLVPAKAEAHIEAYIPEVASAPTPPLPPSFLSLRIRPPHIRVAMAQMRAAETSTYHSLLPSGTPPLLPIPLPVPSTSRRAEIPEADTPPRKRLLLTALRPGCEVGESSTAVAVRQPRPTMARSVDCSFVDTIETSRKSLEFYSRHHDAQKDRAAVRAEIDVLRREKLAYEQESIQTREALARSEAYTVRAEIDVLRREKLAYEQENDLVVQHIMRTQALEAEARIDTLENTGRAYAAGNSDRNIYTQGLNLYVPSVITIMKGGNDNAQARVYVVGNVGVNPDNVVAGTFLLNNRYAYILFDTGTDRTFVSTTFSSQIDITPIALDHHYNVEIADGRIIGLNNIMRDCTLNFLNHPFNIDLPPVELGSFDVIIGMYWLSRYNVVIACAEKLVCIPFGNEILTIHGEGSNERNESRLNIISYSKAQEYMSKGCHVFLANITFTKDEDKSKGKRLEDIPVVQEFPEVFPEDLP